MHKFIQTVRTTLLYVLTVVLVGGVPMSVYADKTPGCLEVNKNANWTTHPTTGECVKKSVIKKEAQQAQQPVPTELPAPEESVPLADDQPKGFTGVDTTVNQDTNIGVDTNTNNNTDVTNNIEADSTSGNAEVNGNQSTGNAGSGDASADTTVINSVHSTVGGGTGVASFTYDIYGDVVGDIVINGPSNSNKTTNINANATVNNDTTLTNNIDLNATSGKADVNGNKSSGSATSGNANTVANILNLINTIIAANQSFVGTINIHGNLNGDILMSPEFIPQLLEANNGSISDVSNMVLTSNINNDTSIVNNVNLAATSGDATVRGNGSEGSATTGTGQTNLTVLNLTGRKVDAKNTLLVFVNVLGKWIGMIVDAPGSTAAAFGSGVTNNTTNITGTSNSTNKDTITNNINLVSQSGDADVNGNKSSGSATSGNATASANIANISTSTFNVSDWFGVLWINVLDTWVGSFGVDTEAGTIVALTGNAVVPPAGAISSPHFNFGFRPTAVDSSAPASPAATAVVNTSDSKYQSAVLASAVAKEAGEAKVQSILQQKSPRSDPFSTFMMVGGFGVAGISAAWMGFRRWVESR